MTEITNVLPEVTMPFVPKHIIRAKFSAAMSDMYKKEVPLYSDLLKIVKETNKEYLNTHPHLEEKLGKLDRISEERHGAIRLGKPEELATIARLFAVMGMYPVGYYDLSVAGLPVHSTAFRPVEKEELALNPFRIFTSLLRTDLLTDKVKELAITHLSKRNIFSDRAIELIAHFEKKGGLTEEETEEFITESLKTFRWHSEASIDKESYETLLKFNGLVADIVSFKGPHINHLTPRTLDIEKLHKKMQDMGIDTIAEIQGPPEGWPILLQQTSFKALDEETKFPDKNGNYQTGKHRARFGEIEQRHVALKPEGTALYDRLTAIAQEKASSLKKRGEAEYQKQYPEMLKEIFKEGFPAKIHEELRKNNLAYFSYHLTEKGKSAKIAKEKSVRQMVDEGLAVAIPITYEDFLPVSAAGIFKANLDDKSGRLTEKQSSNQELFEQSLGGHVTDFHKLYQQEEDASIKHLYEYKK